MGRRGKERENRKLHAKSSICISSRLGEEKKEETRKSLNQGFPMPTNNSHTQTLQSIGVRGFDDGGGGEHWVFGRNMVGVFGRLLDCFHFFLAAGVIPGAYNDGLADDYVLCA
jgi:hypothetical protein